MVIPPLKTVMPGAAVYFVLFLASAGALTHEPPTETSPPSEDSTGAYRLALGGHLLLGVPGPCRASGDVHGCVTAALTAGFQVGFHYFISVPRFALGFLGSGDWELDASQYDCGDGDCSYTDDRFVLWRGAVEGLFYPFVGSRIKLWIGVEAGVAVVVDVHETIEHNDIVSTDRVGDAAPEAGLGFGMDIGVTRGVFLGFEMRAVATLFTAGEKTTPDASTNMTLGLWTYWGLLTIGYSPPF